MFQRADSSGMYSASYCDSVFIEKINVNLKSTTSVVKENVGETFMVAEGKTKTNESNVEFERAQAEGYAQSAVEKFTGDVNDTIGSEQMQAESTISHTKGDTHMRDQHRRDLPPQMFRKRLHKIMN
ncbi:hypothetical protein K7432_003058 [Basidiobolus ranarum]|uniref:Uncharacterized protein n=1 Tax=Basidiobolus ranarum TaxID=34480 RepID=A0ABR2X0G2_9FUNG